MSRGKPKTEAERKASHKRKYGTDKVPARKHKNWK
jgi:hypothetical protein